MEIAFFSAQITFFSVEIVFFSEKSEICTGVCTENNAISSGKLKKNPSRSESRLGPFVSFGGISRLLTLDD